MRIVSERTLREYWEKHPEVRGALEAWRFFVKQAKWKRPEDVQKDYGDDVILPDNRAVFNIKGNQYRIVVRFNYSAQAVYIRFIGTHAEYDKIDAVRE